MFTMMPHSCIVLEKMDILYIVTNQVLQCLCDIIMTMLQCREEDLGMEAIQHYAAQHFLYFWIQFQKGFEL